MTYRVCPDCLTRMPGSAMERNCGKMRCRSNLQCLNRAASKLRAMQLTGAKMSNVCYNLSQRGDLHVNDRAMLGQLYREWDVAVKGGGR